MDVFRYSDSILTDCELSIDVSNIIRNLIDVVSNQNEEIQNLKNRFDSIESSTKKSISQMNAQVMEQTVMIQTEIPKKVITETKKSETDLTRKIANLDDTINKLRNRISENDEWSSQRMEVLEKRNQNELADIRSIILEMQQQPLKLPTTYEKECDQPQTVNGVTDISPLIRGIYRDSRRLDGFEEIISRTRCECKEIVDSVIAVQENLVQFNHNIHDLSLTDGKISRRVTETAYFFSESFESNDKHLSDLYFCVGKLVNLVHSAVTIIIESFEQMETVISKISQRYFPALPSLAECQLEIFGLKEEVFDKKTIYDDERSKFRRSPDVSCPSQTFKDVSVKVMDRKDDHNLMRKLFHNDNIKFNKSINDNTTLSLMIDDLFDKFSVMKQELACTENHIVDVENQQKEAIKNAFNNQSTEFELGKLQTILSKLSSRVAALETKSKKLIPKETKKFAQTESFNDALVTGRSVTREKTQRRSQTSAAKYPKKTYRLVADKIASPF